MIYTDDEGREFGLPKYTVALAEAFEAASSDMAVRERCDMRLSLMKKCLGSDYVAERCGGKTLQSIDVAALDGLFAEVHAAYRRGARRADVEAAMAEVEKLAPMIEMLEKAAALDASVASRSGFKRVF